MSDDDAKVMARFREYIKTVKSQEWIATPQVLVDTLALIERLNTEVKDLDRECTGLYGYIDSVDNSISQSLEAIGEFAGTMGCADRIDMACRLLESIPDLRLEIEQSKTRKCVHELAKEFSNSITGDY